MIFFEGIDVNETRASKDSATCHYWYFLGKGFKFQPNFCHGCHDILTMNINLSDIDILNIKSADYCCITSGISINEAINVMQNADFT